VIAVAGPIALPSASARVRDSGGRPVGTAPTPTPPRKTGSPVSAGTDAGESRLPSAASATGLSGTSADRSTGAHARVHARDAGGQHPETAVRALRAEDQPARAAKPDRQLAAPGAGAGEEATRQALQQRDRAAQSAESLEREAASAGRRRGGGHETHGKGGGRRKHHGSPGEPPVSPGQPPVSPGQPVPSATGVGEGHARAAAVTNSAPVNHAPAAVPAPLTSLVPQLAALTAQPLGGARPSVQRSASHQRARTHGALAVASFTTIAPAVASASESGTGAATASGAKVVPAAARAKGGNALERIGRQIPLPIPVPDWSKPVIVALLALALALALRAAAAGARARRLERESAGLLRDLGAMQAALVPEVPARVGGLDISVAYRPAEGPAAGGDFYDLFVPRMGVVAMMLGDVSGHGHEALTHAALTRYTLRAYLQAGLEPRMALALAGRVLSDRSGARYATVAVGIYDGTAGTLTYALAGHPPPVFLGPDGMEPVTAGSSPPVGWGAPTGRRQTTVSLSRGSEVCFFSDGLVEARHEGRLLGRDQLRRLLAGLGAQPSAEQLLEEVRRAAPAAPDDMVACILSAPGAPGAARVRVEELEVDAQALQRSGVRRFLCECKVAPAQLDAALQRARALVSATGGALLRVEVGTSSSVHVSAAPTADADIGAARGGGGGAREELALASLAAH
jgi:hypothetical protein